MRSHAIAAPPLAVPIFLSALAVLPINMFVPSLPNIARDLKVDFAVINAAIAGYAVATAVVHLLAGALSDRWGRRPVAFAALALFVFASIGCSLATNIRVFLLCRLCQGAVIAGYVISLAVIRETSDARGVAGRIGYVSSAWAVAPMLGPALGGLIDAHFGWRANFVTFALLGMAGLYLVAFHLHETNVCRSAAMASPLRGYAEVLASPGFRAHALCMAL
ncbi:MAG: MFS transporter [Comamonadaceae bacterium]|nr:MAG: MFS transporter [Comamonadaceae bacterium]